MNSDMVAGSILTHVSNFSTPESKKNNKAPPIRVIVILRDSNKGDYHE